MRDPLEVGDVGDRVAHHLVQADLGVEETVDEGRIGAVFEEPAHEVGKQFLVAADRGIHAYARQVGKLA